LHQQGESLRKLQESELKENKSTKGEKGGSKSRIIVEGKCRICRDRTTERSLHSTGNQYEEESHFLTDGGSGSTFSCGEAA